MLLRGVVGVALIGYLVWRADLSSVVDSIEEASLGYALLAFVLLLAALVLGALRWRPYLQGLGFEISVSSSIQLALIGAFFNAFLPTGIGGDTYKALRLPRHPGTMRDAFASVLLDRAAGVIGMAVLAIIGVMSQMGGPEGGSVPVLALITCVVVFGSYSVLLVLGRRNSSTPSVSAGVVRRGLLFLRTVSRGAGDVRASRRAIAIGIATAVLFLAANVSLARALHLSAPLGGLALLLLLASVVAILPLSINGIGLREAVYVWGLGSYGVGRDAAIAFAFFVLATALASSAVGGIVYIAVGGRRAVSDGNAWA